MLAAACCQLNATGPAVLAYSVGMTRLALSMTAFTVSILRTAAVLLLTLLCRMLPVKGFAPCTRREKFVKVQHPTPEVCIM